MSGDSDRDAVGDGASSDERDAVPEVHDDGSGDPLDVDREFARIVAAWAAETGTEQAPVGPWPASEDVDDAAPPAAGRSRDDLRAPGHRVVREPRDTAPADEGATPEPPLIWRGPIGPAADGAAGADQLDDALEEERYVPPEPPPLGGDLVSRLSWAAVLGGPLFLVVAVIFWQDLPRLLLLAALAAFVGGFVALVARMPDHRDPDGDDGAIV